MDKKYSHVLDWDYLTAIDAAELAAFFHSRILCHSCVGFGDVGDLAVHKFLRVKSFRCP